MFECEKLTNEQRDLARYMSEISEDCYCAGWIMGLEYSLWSAVLHGPAKYGMGEITANNIDELKRLSEQIGGWIYWDDDTSETFILMNEWLEKYDRFDRDQI